MKNLKKISALILALVLVLSLSAAAFAATTLDGNGEQGAFTTEDTPTSQSKTLVLSKEITAYNVDETTIKAPIRSMEMANRARLPLRILLLPRARPLF